MLISDVEVPEHDTTTLRLMLASAAQRNIKRLCILGDFLASDAFSAWPPLHAKPSNTTYAQEFEIAVDIVAAMFIWFDEVYLIEGNHDRRANKATQGEIGLKFLMDLAFKFANVQPCVTRLNHLWLDTPRGPWLLHHPQRGYSRIPGRLPRSYWEVMTLPPQLLRKYGPIKPHVIGTHTHHLAEVMSPGGQCQLIEIGCCRDKERTGYIQDSSTFPRWNNGFGLVQDGFGEAYSRKPIRGSNLF